MALQGSKSLYELLYCTKELTRLCKFVQVAKPNERVLQYAMSPWNATMAANDAAELEIPVC